MNAATKQRQASRSPNRSASPTPLWVPCPDGCGEFWCNRHQTHAHECQCPPIDELTFDPYTTNAPAANTKTNPNPAQLRREKMGAPRRSAAGGRRDKPGRTRKTTGCLRHTRRPDAFGEIAINLKAAIRHAEAISLADNNSIEERHWLLMHLRSAEKIANQARQQAR